MIVSRYRATPRYYLPFVISAVLFLTIVLTPSLGRAQTNQADIDTMNRLANFTRMGVDIHALVKLPSDGNSATQSDSAVYYLGRDGRRHAFPNAKVYSSWYDTFAGVRMVSGPDLASIPLGDNVTYHPGVKLVKFLTDTHVYAVAGNSRLQWVQSENVAQDLYGMDWRMKIDDILDIFYMDYTINPNDIIRFSGDYSAYTMRMNFSNPSEALGL